MQTDTRLIQNIGNTDQTGTDLCCQPDTLCLSARQGSGCTRQRQIIQSHIHQKPGTRLDFL